jgi:hypothetical protein
MEKDYELRATSIVDSIDSNIFSTSKEIEVVKCRTAIAQVYATLALVEQTKRLADLNQAVHEQNIKREQLDDQHLAVEGLIKTLNRTIQLVSKKENDGDDLEGTKLK